MCETLCIIYFVGFIQPGHGGEELIACNVVIRSVMTLFWFLVWTMTFNWRCTCINVIKRIVLKNVQRPLK